MTRRRVPITAAMSSSWGRVNWGPISFSGATLTFDRTNGLCSPSSFHISCMRIFADIERGEINPSGS